MNTYCYRLKFYTHSTGVIKYAEKKYLFNLPNGSRIQLSCLDSYSISTGKELALTSGGYSTKKEAFCSGIAMKNSLLVTGAKLRIGIDAGKNEATCWLNPTKEQNIITTHDTQIVDDVHGVLVYDEEHPITILSAIKGELILASNAQTFSSNLCDFFTVSGVLTEKQKLALELYGASRFEKSYRARFLTLILGIETLLNPEVRRNKVKEVVHHLCTYVAESDLDDSEKKSIKGSLKWLNKDSITQSLRKMAKGYLTDKIYHGFNPEEFIKECYKVRSNLVHNGKSDEENISVLVENLDVYLSDLIQALILSNYPLSNRNHAATQN